jgi:hypothetical protein
MPKLLSYCTCIFSSGIQAERNISFHRFTVSLCLQTVVGTLAVHDQVDQSYLSQSLQGRLLKRSRFFLCFLFILTQIERGSYQIKPVSRWSTGWTVSLGRWLLSWCLSWYFRRSLGWSAGCPHSSWGLCWAVCWTSRRSYSSGSSGWTWCRTPRCANSCGSWTVCRTASSLHPCWRTSWKARRSVLQRVRPGGILI